MDNIITEEVENPLIIIKPPEYICPVHGKIKSQTMKIMDTDNDVELTHCCLYCLADLINKVTPKIERIGQYG